MNKRHVTMLGVIAFCLIAGNVKQHLNVPVLGRFGFYALGFALDAVLLWAVFILGKMKPREQDSTLSIVPSSLFVLGAFVLGLVAAKLSLELVSLSGPGIKEEATQALEGVARSKSWLSQFRTMLMTPIMEEIVFRVGVLGALMTVVKRPLAIALSSAVFALAHFSIYPASAWLSVFCIGVFLSVTYLQLGLSWSIVLHVLHNTQSHHLSRISSDAGAVLFFGLALVGIFVFILTLRTNFNVQNQSGSPAKRLRASLRARRTRYGYRFQNSLGVSRPHLLEWKSGR